ncbi:bifunctional ADP-dependent NAD(P)H-hydrate dehydratase/NAD(P)H-hydrate epimerase [Sphingomonas oleivorans]|uniref:Bifunctional NAD(P)H-hydrate repair enzyme n=1 Tax=Sphingomonas oleivorans TaxID=1735121 RepID=A0A2T5FWR5_9SPHN|nr:NAD(P)H-hydrate dehydratase [Sphingomonas oleivorans]PTQ10227.1 bifunctional ADP-dependent NAD(P)H-hydrate dehydratase/NAD(P)H-hydrate epimerase [Sphingomonas oleivorans]
MKPIVTAAEMRAAEAAVIGGGTSVETLMERAGEAIAEAAWRYAGTAPALILCGPGNNGGDGYVAGRLLRERGVPVRIAASAEPRTDAARAARVAWDGPVEPLADARPAPLLIDALFGTGLTRPLDPSLGDALDRLAGAARYRIAVDLPSGVGTDDGILLGPVPRFDLTIALGALKPAHRLQPSAALCGRVAVADIGVPVTARLGEVARPRLPPPGPADNKYSRGMVAVIGGEMPGAAILAATAAQRAGAGYVALFGGGPGAPAALVRKDIGDQAALSDPRLCAIVIGPGLGRTEEARAALDRALGTGKPLLLDADALSLLAGRPLPRFVAPTLMTPHEGEFLRLFGRIEGSKVERARLAAARAGAVVLLKGADSVIAAPDGRAAIAPPAPSWLASAGTGDVLAGIAGAMLARGLDAFDAGCAALWLHGRAAEMAGPALIADDLAQHLAPALAACG